MEKEINKKTSFRLGELCNRFGVFHRRMYRHFQPYIKVKKSSYISGHKGIELYIGSHFWSLIYKF